MLVPKKSKFATGEIIGLKLTTGQEVICKIGIMGTTEFEAINLLFLAQTPEGPAFSPMLSMIAEDTHPFIARSLVAMHFVIHQNVMNTYLEATTDFVLPKKTAIILSQI